MDQILKELENRIETLEKNQNEKLAAVLDKKTKKLIGELKVQKQQFDLLIASSSNTVNEIKGRLTEANEIFARITEVERVVSLDEKAGKEKVSQVEKLLEEVTQHSEMIYSDFRSLQTVFQQLPSLQENIEQFAEVERQINEASAKVKSLLTNISEKKQEFDAVYFDVLGYVDENENGEPITIGGKKEELEKSYNNLKAEVTIVKKDITELKQASVEDFQKFAEDKNEEYKIKVQEWNDTFTLVNKKIAGLLPDALTAGLSHAYHEKKKDEIAEGEKHEEAFRNAIRALVVVSLIPFAVSLVSLFRGDDLEEIIFRLPRIASAILPLYVPVLWLAYSANKRKNLSKRLVEEYTHKEVLSKTFEGLSTQIENIDDKAISEELRVKLLYNILEVNSENPGKLISDYKKSDHPLIDALDKSVKLANAVENLSKIPGFAKLASKLDEKAKSLLKKEDEKASAALDSSDEKGR